ncbi:hypothetical protein BDZ89DRAFT_616456 [Hymenopellis radicata]|nr:hypothetical protein BDZ89DRAFT_616456 [Hymenopellis radicata]
MRSVLGKIITFPLASQSCSSLSCILGHPIIICFVKEVPVPSGRAAALSRLLMGT